MRAFYDLIQPERLTAVVDVGALPIDGEPAYAQMLDDGLCTVVGIDPQTGLVPTHPAVRQVSAVVGTGLSGMLNVCASPGMTSMLEPDERNLAAFAGLAHHAKVTTRMAVSPRRLDDIDEVSHIDFLKIDAQGSEIDILASAPRKLRNAVAVMVEVSFVTLYRKQSHFGIIDSWLRDAGFLPHCFADAKLWTLATKTDLPKQVQPHQLLEADIVYVRDFTRHMRPDQWQHMAMVAHHVLGSYDLAMLAVERCAEAGVASAEAPMLYRQILGTM